MSEIDYAQVAEFLSNDLRLKTLPVAVKFLKSKNEFPEKTRQPSVALGKRVTICQGMTMARLYGWTVGLAKEDLICVPAMIAFGFSGAPDPKESLASLFCQVEFSRDREQALRETESIVRLQNAEYEALLLAPLQKQQFVPDTIAVYGNPAQIMRLIQAWVFKEGNRVPGNFGGKVECSQYLVEPFKSGTAQIVIPGMGDRIFSMTQDDEMVFALPGSKLQGLVDGLKGAGKKIGARYPVTFYQNFQPEFPKPYKAMADELGMF
mgnify:CR=1 FL=1